MTRFKILELFNVWENPTWGELPTDHFWGYALASGSRSSRRSSTFF